MASNYINLAQITRMTAYPKSRVYPNTLQPYTWVVNGGWWNRLKGKTPTTVTGYRRELWSGYEYLSGTELIEFLNEYDAYINTDDNNIYYHPHVEIWTSDERRTNKFFLTEQELNHWITRARIQVPTITLLNK